MSLYKNSKTKESGGGNWLIICNLQDNNSCSKVLGILFRFEEGNISYAYWLLNN